MSNFRKVEEFFVKFGLPTVENYAPHVPTPEAFLFRYGHIMEEMTELLQAYRKGDVMEMADALADILYLTYGTAHVCGIPVDDVFAEVHRANMQKERSTGADDPRGKRSSGLDIVKPAGWKAPDVAGVLLKRHLDMIGDRDENQVA